MICSGILLLGCEHGPVGIFVGIETEVEVVDSDLGGTTFVNGLIWDGSNYYVAIKRLHKRATNSDDWRGVGHPSGFSNGQVADIERVEGKNFVAFSHESRERYGLFELDSGNDSWGENLYSDGEIVRLIGIDTDKNGTTDRLFLVVRIGDNAAHRLVHYDPSSDVFTTIADPVPEILDGDWSGIDSEYLFLSNSVIYTTSDPTDATMTLRRLPTEYIATMADGSFIAVDNERFGGVLTVGMSEIYISSADGYIYYSAGGSAGPWSRSGRSSSRAYSDLIDHGDGVVVGLRHIRSSTGYRELVAGNINSIDTPTGNNYRSTMLSRVTVAQFIVIENTLFALSHGAGLWRADYGSPARLENSPNWSWE